MKKVLHVITSYDVFGPEKTTINECSVLQERGWQASILNLDPHRSPPFTVKSRQRGVTCRGLAAGGVPGLKDLLALRREFKALGDGVVHSHGYKADVLTLVASAGLKLPIVTTIHGWTSENLKVRLYERLQVFSWRFFDRVFCVSNSYRKVGLKRGLSPSRLHLVYNGIVTSGHPAACGTDLRRRIAPKGELVVSIIGRLSIEKGHRAFVMIADRIIAGGRKAKFLIVGEGAERPAIENLVRERGLEGKVILLGHVDEMPSVYGASDVVAICSDREGLPNVLLESMLNATPVVSFSVGGVPEVAGKEEGCLVVPHGDIDGFAARLTELLDSKERRVELGELGVKRVKEHFSFDARTSRITAHYEELMAGAHKEGRP